MASQNSRAVFGVRADSGTIYVKEPLDYEQRQQYTLVLDVTDGQHTCVVVFWRVFKQAANVQSFDEHHHQHHRRQ